MTLRGLPQHPRRCELTRTPQVHRVGTARLWLCLVCIVSMVALLVGAVVSARAQSPSKNHSPIGFWDSFVYIMDWGPTYPADKPPGGPFPNPTTITVYDPATGAFSGIDDAWDIGKETITGTLHSDGTLTYTIGKDLHGQGTVTFYPDGSAIWTGTWSNSIGERGTVHATLKNFEMRGTVEGVVCNETSCTPSGLGGLTILATGQDRVGNSVSVTDVTDDDGSWSVTVPAGLYRVGPVLQDGVTFVGPAFEPETASVSVPMRPGTTVDFKTCVQAGDSPDDTPSEASEATTGRMMRAEQLASVSGDPVSQCTSLYTLTLKATLPPGHIVDVSLKARYQTASEPPYRSGSGEFPVCFTPEEEKTYADDSIEWYSYITGGALPSVSFKLAGTRAMAVSNAATRS